MMLTTKAASARSPSMNYITTTTNGDEQNEVNGNHHIELLAREQLEPSDNEQAPDESDQKASNGATDEELTPLHWLHDNNLLKGINLSCKVQSLNDGTQRNRSCIASAQNDSIDATDDVVEGISSAANSPSEIDGPSTLSPSPKPINYATNDYNSSNLLINSLSSVKCLDKNSQNSLSNPITVTSTTKNDINTKSAAGLSINTFDHYHSSNLSSEESINQIIKSPQTPHQHFHKRYLRETLKQQDEEKRQQEQSHIQNAHMSSYIITNRDFIASYSSHNNNNNSAVQSNYEKCRDHDLSQKIIDYATPKAGYSSGSSVASSSPSSPSSRPKPHPNSVPYDPLVHTASKPPYSFSSLIFMAIEDSLQKALPVKEIYAWIIQHFPYFKTAPTGWKNSVRHNLSLNKCFQKVEKAANLGKGSLWMVEPQYRPNLIQALTRSPFHPCSTWEKHAKNLIKPESESPTSKMQQANGSARLPNPEHFPFLSRRLAAAMDNYDEESQSRASSPLTNYEMPQNYTSNGMVICQSSNSSVANGNFHNSDLMSRELNAETMEDVNAATAMLALKHGPKIFTEGIPFPPVITTSPSEDHTYSAFTGGKNGADNNSNGTSSDAAYESSEESPNVVFQFSQPSNDQEMEEQRRQAEGVDALLNLAGYNTNTTLLLKRPASVEFERKQYFYTTEIAPSNQYQTNEYFIEEPASKKPRSRILRNKLKKKSWYR